MQLNLKKRKIEKEKEIKNQRTEKYNLAGKFSGKITTITKTIIMVGNKDIKSHLGFHQWLTPGIEKVHRHPIGQVEFVNYNHLRGITRQ